MSECLRKWQAKAAPFVRAVEKRYDALKYRLYYALGGPGAVKIQAYRGYGTKERVYVKGRVLEERGIRRPSETDSWWDNLVSMYKRLQSREIPYARLLARFEDVEAEVTADEEGMFELWMESSESIPEGEMWQSVELELLEPESDKQEEPVRATGRVLIPPSEAPFGVISDIDDTVIQSDIGSFLGMLGTILFSNARTRLPLPGVAAFYRALHAGPDGDARAPMFYVSNGLWNLYDLLDDFFRWNGIPGGPVLLLRNWGVYRDELLPMDQRAHKLGLIRPILDLYSDLPFMLIGDSGEADPEIYHGLVEEYGEQILVVYIRKVGRDVERPAAIRALADEIVDAGSELVLADDSLSMARHAAQRGWIQKRELALIASEQAQRGGLPGPADYIPAIAERGKVVHVEGSVDEGTIQSSLEEAEDRKVSTVVVEPKKEA